MNPITQWDFSVLEAIASLRTPGGDAFFSAVTRLGDGGILWILLAAGLLCFRKTRPLGLCVSLALVFDLLLCNLCLKPLVGRLRPFVLAEVEPLIPAPRDFSFPSGHTAASFAAAGVLAFRRSKLAIPALSLAAVIGFSRLYLFVHFPTDVLGGMAVGLGCGFLGCYAGRLFCKRLRWEN